MAGSAKTSILNHNTNVVPESFTYVLHTYEHSTCDVARQTHFKHIFQNRNDAQKHGLKLCNITNIKIPVFCD